VGGWSPSGLFIFYYNQFNRKLSAEKGEEMHLKTYLFSTLALGFVSLMPVASSAQTTDMPEKINNQQEVAAIDGNCPVCFMNGYINKGNERYWALYKSRKYLFDTSEDRRLFLENPEIYTQGLDLRYKEKIKS
jgi:hypothetical protein